MDLQTAAFITLQQIQSHVESLKALGTPGFDCTPDTLQSLKKITSGLALPGHFPQDTLESVRQDLGDCQRCQLHATRNTIVFGSGNPNARLVFVGEAPGYEEDLSGEPFVGPAGQLLTRIIQAIKMKREDVYICNIVKCRPPRNRNPLPEEIQTCIPFLHRQLAVIQPEFICTLGAIATQSLLDTDLPISRLRGRFHDLNGIRIMPTFHPSYLLRNPEKKRDVWNDMKQLMNAMGIAYDS